MCGIAGIIGKADRELIKEMTDIMSHRGPDDWGVEVFDEDRVSLGHRRLSIIDLSPAGHQPMCDDSEQVWITYNGEIYNYLEIRDELQVKGYKFKSNTDTEVIIYAYKEWGYDCLHKFNGMFAFGIWDKRDKTLFLARDRLGIKPLYYAKTPSHFIFASEIKSILNSGLVKKDVDYEAFNTIWHFQVTPQTGFKGIKKLPPAHYGIFKDGNFNLHQYWEINVSSHPISNLSKTAQKLRELIEDAVHKQMIADVPVGAFLSGGLDSSCIVAFMFASLSSLALLNRQKYSSSPIHTFTIKFSEKDKRFESMPEDDVYARQVAEYIGTHHKEFELQPDVLSLLPKMIYHIEEPLADPAAINMYLISKYAREQGIIVLLNGMGGDEIFGGYRKTRACLLAEQYQNLLPFPLRQFLRWMINKLPVASRTSGFRYLRWLKLFNRFAHFNSADRFISTYSLVPVDEISNLFSIDFLSSTNNSWALEKHYSFFTGNNLSYLQQMALCDTKIFLPDHNLTYSDKATMAASVESRPPLIDHRIVEFAFQLADTLKIRGNQQKVILRESMKEVLPKAIVNRPKAPFYSKELDIRFSRSYGPGRYDVDYEEKGIDYPYGYVRWTEKRNMEAFLNLVAEEKINVEPLISHKFKIYDAQKAYDLILGKTDERALGVLFEYEASGESKFTKVHLNVKASKYKVAKERIGVGFIGAGNFAQGFLLPPLKKLSNVSLIGVVTASSINAKNVAGKFGFGFCSTSAEDVFQNNDIDCVFIATQHNLHAKLVTEALKHHKHVYVEKPLALNENELSEIMQSANDSDCYLAVGFNRRFSPFVKTLKDFIVGNGYRHLVMNYRINAGSVPPDHWTQEAEVGGGRIIGEVCHFVDTLMYLCGSRLTKIYASSLPLEGVPHPPDNVVINIIFTNGSVGNITYTSVGDRTLPKERIEVFSAGTASVIDDFKSLEIYSGGKRVKKIKKRTHEKGYKEEILNFLEVISGKAKPIFTLDELVHVTQATFKIHESLALGKPVEL